MEALFRRLQEAIPDPHTELYHSNHYTLLVAVVLSARATDVSVNKVTSALFALADTPEKMLELGEEGLKQHVKTIGLYPTKARHIIALSEQLLREHHGQVPCELEALMRLPGVGIKTAKVLQNTAFGMSTIAVDTHVHRVANRLGLVTTPSPARTQQIIESRIPDHWKHLAHHLLILHGRYCCTARKPRCEECCLAEYCPSRGISK